MTTQSGLEHWPRSATFTNASKRLLSFNSTHKDHNLASSLRTPAASNLVQFQTHRTKAEQWHNAYCLCRSSDKEEGSSVVQAACNTQLARDKTAVCTVQHQPPSGDFNYPKVPSHNSHLAATPQTWRWLAETTWNINPKSMSVAYFSAL
jgi:hypothetical protein